MHQVSAIVNLLCIRYCDVGPVLRRWAIALDATSRTTAYVNKLGEV